jgi:hypothetical protein
MRLKYFAFFLSLFLFLVINGFFIIKLPANSSGAPSGRAGAPAESGATCTGCHAGTSTSLAGLITSNVPVSGFIPGQDYTVTGTISRPSITKYGFSISPQNSSGTLMGSMTTTSSETQLVGLNKYITHTSSGTNAPSGTKSWSFTWTAPAVDSVIFYGAFLAANGNSSTSGDNTFTSQLKLYSQTFLSVKHQEWLEKSIVLYPNPVTENQIYVQTDAGKIETVRITDNSGKLIKAIQPAQENTFVVSLENLNNGIYFAEIILQNKGRVVKKIMKL